LRKAIIVGGGGAAWGYIMKRVSGATPAKVGGVALNSDKSI